MYAGGVAPGMLAMAARRIVATSEEGGHHCHQFSSVVMASILQLLNRLFINNVLSLAQAAASHCA